MGRSTFPAEHFGNLLSCKGSSAIQGEAVCCFIRKKRSSLNEETCTSLQRVIEHMHTFFHGELLKNSSFGHLRHAELVWREIMK